MTTLFKDSVSCGVIASEQWLALMMWAGDKRLQVETSQVKLVEKFDDPAVKKLLAFFKATGSVVMYAPKIDLNG